MKDDNPSLRYDFYAELSKHTDEEIKYLIKNEWETIWRNKGIKLKNRQRQFERKFTQTIWPLLLKSHKLDVLHKNKKMIFYEIFVILKVLEGNLKYLSNFAKKNLKKRVHNREYYPKIPEHLSKEIYLELFRSENWKINMRLDLDKFGISEQLLRTFGIKTEFAPPRNLPEYSTYIQISFKLKKPYISKDDDDFYTIENPIVKDKVFKLPMVRPTTWKGALRFAAIKVFEDWVYEKLNKSKLDREAVFKERAKIVMLFGNEKDSQEEYLGKLCLLAIEGELPAGEKLKEEVEKINREFEKWLIDEKIISKDIPSRSGRLFFYPTFFEEISLDVITPLSRETRTPVRGRGPIYFETVPERVEGVFRLLYYPFDLIARGWLDEIERVMENDLTFLSEALKKMFYETGFSAKKTGGFGVVEQINDNDIKVYGFKSNEVKEFLNGIHQS